MRPVPEQRDHIQHEINASQAQPMEQLSHIVKVRVYTAEQGYDSQLRSVLVTSHKDYSFN